MAGNTCIGCGAEIETGATKMYCDLCRPLGIDIEKRPNSMQDWMRAYWASQEATRPTVEVHRASYVDRWSEV
jgi:hypothetical protein